MRNDAVHASSVTNAQEYEQHNQLAREVEVFLRKNIVQGIKLGEETQGSAETWRMSFSLSYVASVH
jgi:phage tail tube protein FII